MSGWTDLPLSEQGLHQVESLRQRVTKGGSFSMVYSSPLKRARHTAEAFGECCAGGARICEGLKEINCGSVDGLPIERVQRQFPELWEANLRQDDPDFRWPGGESYREFRARSTAAIRSIAARHPGERVALVTHAGVISQILGFLFGVSPARWEEHRVGNTALTELDWMGDSGVLVAFDDSSHLLRGDVPGEGAGASDG